MAVAGAERSFSARPREKPPKASPPRANARKGGRSDGGGRGGLSHYCFFAFDVTVDSKSPIFGLTAFTLLFLIDRFFLQYALFLLLSCTKSAFSAGLFSASAECSKKFFLAVCFSGKLLF